MAFLKCAAFTRKAQLLPPEAAAAVVVEPRVAEAVAQDEVVEPPAAEPLEERRVVVSAAAVAVLVAEPRPLQLRHLPHQRPRLLMRGSPTLHPEPIPQSTARCSARMRPHVRLRPRLCLARERWPPLSD
jgi:hypothetical protein